MGPIGPHFELTYIVSIGFKGRISSKFAFVHKRILVIMQGYTGVSEQGIWIWVN